eukprot:gene10888-12044_t
MALQRFIYWLVVFNFMIQSCDVKSHNFAPTHSVTRPTTGATTTVPVNTIGTKYIQLKSTAKQQDAYSPLANGTDSTLLILRNLTSQAELNVLLYRFPNMFQILETIIKMQQSTFIAPTYNESTATTAHSTNASKNGSKIVNSTVDGQGAFENIREICILIEISLISQGRCMNSALGRSNQAQSCRNKENNLEYNNKQTLLKSLGDICGAPVHGIQISSKYLLLAIKVLAKTVTISNEQRCRDLKGRFDAVKQTCFIKGMNSPARGITSHNVNATKNYTTIAFNNSGKESSFASSLRYINVVCHCCSLLSLGLLITSYFLAKDHFSLPDKNILCLSLSLCLSHAVQLLIVFFHENYTFCKTTGILLHWALLLVFFWMAAMSFDFFITFAKIRPPNVDASNARFKKYLVVVVTTASTIVLACIFIGIPHQDYSGYGINGVCFVSKFWPNLFAFAIPVAIILLANVGLLSATIFKLRALREASNKVLSAPNSQRSNSRKKIVLSLLTLKLSVLFGIGWLLGYIDGVVKSEALEVCFNLVVSLQGTFVFLVFGCPRKALMAIKAISNKAKVESDNVKSTTSVV